MKNPSHRVQATKQLLRHSLTGLLTEKPLSRITVKELCERANLNRGTFYAHYADVYDLMEQIESELSANFVAAIEPMLSSIGQPTPPKVTKKVFECIEANADLCRVTIGPYGNTEFAHELIRACRERCIQSCVQYYPNAARWQIDAYFSFVTGGCFALMKQWLCGNMTESSSTLADAAETIMEKGVAFLQQEA